jgi:hypothetical protein
MVLLFYFAGMLGPRFPAQSVARFASPSAFSCRENTNPGRCKIVSVAGIKPGIDAFTTVRILFAVKESVAPSS